MTFKQILSWVPMALLALTGYLAYRASQNAGVCYLNDTYRDTYWAYKVTRKYKDKRDHATPTLDVSDGKGNGGSIGLPLERSHLYAGAAVGDSLYKPVGTLRVHLFRAKDQKDTIYNLNFCSDDKLKKRGYAVTETE